MTDITPPPELVQQWIAEIWHEGTPVQVAHSDIHIATRAAQWGADQELEQCLVLVLNKWGADAIRAARRPKHKTRAEIALEQYDRCVSILKEKGYSPAHCIRDALVYLKQLEESND